MTESKLRSIIAQVIMEIAKEKKEEERAEPSKVRDSAKKYLKTKKVMAESKVTTSEWKRQELFGLLTERFVGKTLSEKTFAGKKELDHDSDGVPKWADKDDEDPEVGSEDEEKEDTIKEKKMTSAEKKEEEKISKKFEKAGVKKKMEDQYGKEKGDKVYYATKRKQAMEKA